MGRTDTCTPAHTATSWQSPGSLQGPPQHEPAVSLLSSSHLLTGLPCPWSHLQPTSPHLCGACPTVPAPQEGRHLVLLHTGTGDGEHSSETEFKGKTGEAVLAGHTDTAGLKQHQPHFSSVLPLFSCACFSPVLLPPLLSPRSFLSLNIPSKMIFPNRESCSCRQFLPIFPWTESLPWTHLEGSHPAHGVAAPSDNQEGPGQENPLVPVDFMEFTSHSYHKPPCSFCKPFYLFIFFNHRTQQTFE